MEMTSEPQARFHPSAQSTLEDNQKYDSLIAIAERKFLEGM
jgi:hypothetical protein